MQARSTTTKDNRMAREFKDSNSDDNINLYSFPRLDKAAVESAITNYALSNFSMLHLPGYELLHKQCDESPSASEREAAFVNMLKNNLFGKANRRVNKRGDVATNNLATLNRDADLNLPVQKSNRSSPKSRKSTLLKPNTRKSTLRKPKSKKSILPKTHKKGNRKNGVRKSSKDDSRNNDIFMEMPASALNSSLPQKVQVTRKSSKDDLRDNGIDNEMPASALNSSLSQRVQVTKINNKTLVVNAIDFVAHPNYFKKQLQDKDECMITERALSDIKCDTPGGCTNQDAVTSKSHTTKINKCRKSSSRSSSYCVPVSQDSNRNQNYETLQKNSNDTVSKNAENTQESSEVRKSVSLSMKSSAFSSIKHMFSLLKNNEGHSAISGNRVNLKKPGTEKVTGCSMPSFNFILCASPSSGPMDVSKMQAKRKATKNFASEKKLKSDSALMFTSPVKDNDALKRTVKAYENPSPSQTQINTTLDRPASSSTVANESLNISNGEQKKCSTESDECQEAQDRSSSKPVKRNENEDATATETAGNKEQAFDERGH